MSTTNSRIVNNFGIRTGFGDNTGLQIGYNYVGLTATSGTVSITCGASTYENIYNVTGALTGNLAIVISGSASLITDNLKIIAKGNSTATYSISLSGDVSSATVTTNVAPAKNYLYNGTFNGTVFVGVPNGTI